MNFKLEKPAKVICLVLGVGLGVLEILVKG